MLLSSIFWKERGKEGIAYMKYLLKDFCPEFQKYKKDDMSITINYCDYLRAETFISYNFLVYFNVNHCLLYPVKTQVIWSKLSQIFECLTAFVISKCCQVKRETLCFQIWFWCFWQDFGSMASRLNLQHQITLLCVTVNQKMFPFQKTGIQVTGISVIFSLTLWVQRHCIPGSVKAGKVHPFLLHGWDICISYFRPCWPWVPWVSAVVFSSTFQWQRKRSSSTQSCIPLDVPALCPEHTHAQVPRAHAVAVELTGVLLQHHGLGSSHPRNNVAAQLKCCGVLHAWTCSGSSVPCI